MDGVRKTNCIGEALRHVDVSTDVDCVERRGGDGRVCGVGVGEDGIVTDKVEYGL